MLGLQFLIIGKCSFLKSTNIFKVLLFIQHFMVNNKVVDQKLCMHKYVNMTFMKLLCTLSFLLTSL